MSRIFITGSSTGLGLMAGEWLASQGHRVVLHARNAARAEAVRRALPEAEAIVEGDLGSIAGAKDVAARVNDLGRFDAVIHNAAVGYRESHHLTGDGLPHVFAINTLSAYILTALIERPGRLVYLSSGMHHHADANLDDILWARRRWNGSTAYAESKLHDTILAFAIARRLDAAAGRQAAQDRLQRLQLVGRLPVAAAVETLDDEALDLRVVEDDDFIADRRMVGTHDLARPYGLAIRHDDPEPLHMHIDLPGSQRLGAHSRAGAW